jgi:hypothetical protein
MMATAVGRNAPCPCGSGKKYKRCCALKPRDTISLRGWLVVSVIGLMLLTGAVVALTSLDKLGERTGPNRVWSEEHGHWH